MLTDFTFSTCLFNYYSATITVLQEWLVASGNAKQVMDLIRYAHLSAQYRYKMLSTNTLLLYIILLLYMLLLLLLCVLTGSTMSVLGCRGYSLACKAELYTVAATSAAEISVSC